MLAWVTPTGRSPNYGQALQKHMRACELILRLITILRYSSPPHRPTGRPHVAFCLDAVLSMNLSSLTSALSEHTSDSQFLDKKPWK